MQASMHAGMHAPAARPPGSRPRRLGGYVAMWVALAASGLAYLGIVASRPDLVGAVNGDHVATGPQSADLAEQLASTKGWLRDLEGELGETRRQLSAERERAARLAEQLAAGEPSRNKAAPEPEKHAAIIAPPVMSLDAVPAQLDPPTAGIRIVNAPPDAGQQSAIVTGTIETNRMAVAEAAAAARAPAAPITFGAPKVVVAPPATPSGIEIADAESLDGLRQSWSALSSGNTDVLRRLSARYRISAGGNGDKPFTLLAGPFPTPAEARRACVALKARGVGCRVGDFTGNAM